MRLASSVFVSLWKFTFYSAVVTEVLKDPKSEGWGEWSPWSECSRSCDSELAVRSRTCLAAVSKPFGYCLGDKEQHKVCSKQDCIVRHNYRQEECDRQNRVPFRGRYYIWEGYHNVRSPCEVTCMSKRYGFIMGFGRYVKNGESCSDAKSSEKKVCFHGKCTAVGCDGIVGSGTKTDHCGVCGGNNESCRIIAGIYTRRHLKYGYNHITRIPEGACHINITELARSRNFLVLKYPNGSSIINGDRQNMKRAGFYYAAGTTFQYDKYASPSCPGECLYGEGPITSDLDVELLFYRKNSGIRYMFTIPKHMIGSVLDNYSNGGSTTRHTGHHSRSGSHGNPSNGRSVASGTHPRISYNEQPKYVSPDDTVSATSRNQALQSGSRSSRTQDAINRFREGYSGVSDTNDNENNIRDSISDRNYPANSNYNIPRGSSFRGTGTRAGNQIYPVHPRPGSQVYNREYPETASRYQSHLSNTIENTRPKLTVPTTIDEVNFHWTIAGFTECSTTCGGGTQETKVVCMKRKSNVIVTDENCDPAKKKVQTIVCNKSPCPPDWYGEPWSVCSKTCGAGIQTRKVECQQRYSANVSIPVSATLCNFDDRPDTVKSCEVTPCAQWSVGNWTICSVNCGIGQKTRDVACQNTAGETVHDNQCGGIRPEDMLQCDMGTCAKGWFQSAWSDKCSSECGPGFHTRIVYCSAEDGSPLPEFKCGEKPRTKKPCKKRRPCGGFWFEGPWTKCQATCGVSNQTRDVVCMKKLDSELFAVVGEANCKEKEKPETKRPCPVLPDCEPEWFMTKWSECSKTCGTGVKTRDMKCLDASLSPNSQCLARRKPSTRRTCNTQECDLPQLDEDPSCKDQWTQCQLVVQARLCPYKYYKEKCCHSCTLHQLKHRKQQDQAHQAS